MTTKSIYSPLSRAVTPLLAVGLLTTACGIEEANDSGESDANSTAEADPFPEREIQFILPNPPGSGPDITFRELARLAEAELGQPIVFVNRPGGDSTIGVAEVAAAEPDGYTIGMAGSAQLLLQPHLQETNYDGPEDLLGIMQADIAPGVLVARSDSDVTTIDDLTRVAQDRRLKLALPGQFNIPDLQAELISRELGIELDKVPFEAGKQVPAVVNGTVDLALAQPGIVLQFVEKGELTIVGVIAEEPLPGVDAPLFLDEGYDITVAAFESVIAPPGVPENRVALLEEAFLTAASSDEFADFLDQSKHQVAPLTSAELTEKLSADTAEYADYIKQFGWADGS